MSSESPVICTVDNKQLRLSLQQDALTVEIENQELLEIYRGVYCYP
jgi:hypothetical protein